MTTNMGHTDRRVRAVVAVLLLGLVLFVTDGALDWVLGVVAVVLGVTAAVGTCPAYLPFGIDTCRHPAT